jgi:hypothetical protein
MRAVSVTVPRERSTASALALDVGAAQRGGAGAVAAAGRAGPGDDVRRVRGLGRVGVRR